MKNCVLSDSDIFEELKKGDVIIHPLIKENVNTSSVDVRLGEWYFREQHPAESSVLYSPWNRVDVERVWGKPQKAEKASEVFKKQKIVIPDDIHKNDLVILLSPGETILAHTIEYIGGKNNITTMMKARSSVGRNFIEVCKCAGWGDVGYTNRWTMEITNNSRHYVIPLVVGRRVAQIVFFKTGKIKNEDYTKSGKYQTKSNLKDMIKSWKPADMLPKMWKDKEIQKR